MPRTPDAAGLLAEVHAAVDRYQYEIARPAVLRAGGLLKWQEGDLTGAIDALRASASVARTQGALPQLGRSLAALEETASAGHCEELAHQAEAERMDVVRQIGAEVCGLVWARALPAANTATC